MKAKPDISEFLKSPLSLNEFLEGGAADKAARQTARPPTATVQKLFRLRWDTCEGLKLVAQQESEAKGRRVTETELVERLIRKYVRLAT